MPRAHPHATLELTQPVVSTLLKGIKDAHGKTCKKNYETRLLDLCRKAMRSAEVWGARAFPGGGNNSMWFSFLSHVHQSIRQNKGGNMKKEKQNPFHTSVAESDVWAWGTAEECRGQAPPE